MRRYTVGNEEQYVTMKEVEYDDLRRSKENVASIIAWLMQAKVEGVFMTRVT